MFGISVKCIPKISLHLGSSFQVIYFLFASSYLIQTCHPRFKNELNGWRLSGQQKYLSLFKNKLAVFHFQLRSIKTKHVYSDNLKQLRIF